MNIINNPYIETTNLKDNLFLNFKEEQVEKKSTFGQTLKDELNKVNEKQIDADVLTEKMVRGDKDVSIHEVMLAGEEAAMSLQLAVQVRNKLVEAYQEISRTQI